ncbi:hypothetical protein C9417_26685 [Rhizobium sp. SEMIA 4088]|nr:hypothetical protein C9417_26685 [Rhizobium sp. SEMIA 4088]
MKKHGLPAPVENGLRKPPRGRSITIVMDFVHWPVSIEWVLTRVPGPFSVSLSVRPGLQAAGGPLPRHMLAFPESKQPLAKKNLRQV